MATFSVFHRVSLHIGQLRTLFKDALPLKRTVMTQAYIIFAYGLAVNLAGFFAFYLDKAAARKGNRRTPESTLLLMAAAGGTAGCIMAQQKFRHKTRKQPFKSYLYTIAGLQVIFALAMCFPNVRQIIIPVLRGLDILPR